MHKEKRKGKNERLAMIKMYSHMIINIQPKRKRLSETVIK
jgi:hypothetical protein